jgi:hypothetical protein
MLHELTHLKWTINRSGGGPKGTNDFIGFFNSADQAGNPPGAPPEKRKADWRNGSRNADNYAWYALYSYWNHLPGGDSDTCKNDAWPAEPKKPNPVAF